MSDQESSTSKAETQPTLPALPKEQADRLWGLCEAVHEVIRMKTTAWTALLEERWTDPSEEGPEELVPRGPDLSGRNRDQDLDRCVRALVERVSREIR
jgi:hypothetical protein